MQTNCDTNHAILRCVLSGSPSIFASKDLLLHLGRDEDDDKCSTHHRQGRKGRRTKNRSSTTVRGNIRNTKRIKRRMQAERKA